MTAANDSLTPWGHVVTFHLILYIIILTSSGKKQNSWRTSKQLARFSKTVKRPPYVCISKTVVLNLVNAETLSTVSSVLVIIFVKIIPLILFNFNKFIIILHNCSFGDRGLSAELWPTGSKNCYNLSIHIWFCKILPILESRTIIGSHEPVA